MTPPGRDAAGSRRRALPRQDFNLDGAICIRDRVTGSSSAAQRVQAGIGEYLASGKLDGAPVLIVHGRSDDRVPVSFSSRPYVALNNLTDGEKSRLRYFEVTNAEHFGTDLPAG